MASLRFPVIPSNPSSPTIYKSPNLQIHSIKPQEHEKHHQILYNSYFRHISSVCKEGKLREAVDILLELDCQHFEIGPDVYGDLLQGCVYERNLSLGKQIHSRIVKRGESLVKDGYVETKLIVFYAKCDRLDVASSLFGKVDEKNVFSWAAMIGVHCRMGFLEDALLGFCEMVGDGFEADNFVVPNVLKACGGLLLLGFGKGVHGYVVKMGFEGCVFVASSLVDMYGKCGAMEDARKVFDKMPDRTVVAWNSMMSSYTQNGMHEDAIRVFCDMRIQAIQPTVVTMVSFLSASANLCALEEGKQGHAVVVINGFDIGNIMGSSLVNLYSKSGLIKDSEKVFDRMPKKDLVAWNLMLSCYVHHKKIEKTLLLCNKMLLQHLNFDSVTMSLITTSAGDAQNLKLGKEAHSHAIRTNLMFDPAVCSSIVDMYAKCNKIHEAKRVFSSVSEKDLVLWNTLLAAYAERGSSGETLKLFYDMQLQGIPPNVVSWNSVIHAFLRNKQVNEALDSFSEMKSSGIEANVITYTILVTGFAQNGFVHEARAFFEEMQKNGIKPNSVTIVGILSACKTSASLSLGRAIHGYIMRHAMNNDKNILLATSVVDMYAKCGSVEQSKRVFDMIKPKELSLYNSMICGYSSHGRASEALEIFDELKNSGLKPDSITFTSVLSLCRHRGLVREGLKIFVDMIKKHEMKPGLEHYSCVVSLLAKNGHEALKFVEKIPFELDSCVLGSLLENEETGVEFVEFLEEKLTKMGANDAGNLVALSNAYAVRGEWEKVWVTRSLMREKGVQKSAGCSWVEVGEEVHVFVANDELRSQSDEICLMLGLLRTDMQES